MAKIAPRDTGWFAGEGGTIADSNSKATNWKIIVGNGGKIADISKSDPYCAGLTRVRIVDMGIERISRNGSYTGFFFNNDYSIMQDDDEESIEELFR